MVTSAWVFHGRGSTIGLGLGCFCGPSFPEGQTWALGLWYVHQAPGSRLLVHKWRVGDGHNISLHVPDSDGNVLPGY